MPERNEYVPGTPNWVDLQTTDQAAAKNFYGSLFGWKYDDNPIDDTAVYSIAQINGRDVGAIAPLGDMAAAGVPPHWNTYISVTDCDATVGLVEKAGGSVMMPPMDVMDAGRMALVADPTGGIVALWQAKNHPGAGLVNENGAWSWNELTTPDIPKAAEFYNKVLGWTSETHAGAMPYTEFKVDGNSIGGAMNPPMPGMPTAWGIYFTVDDCDATVAKVKSLGGAVFVEPNDIEPGRFAVVADPQGAVFSVITPKP
jgi:uncharacterized protein